MFILVTRQKVNRHPLPAGPAAGGREGGARGPGRDAGASGSLLRACMPALAQLPNSGGRCDHRFALLFLLRGQRGGDVPGARIERGEVRA